MSGFQRHRIVAGIGRATPGVRLYVGERRAIVDLVVATPKFSFEFSEKVEVAVELRLLNFHLHVAVTELEPVTIIFRRRCPPAPLAKPPQDREVLAPVHRGGAAGSWPHRARRSSRTDCRNPIRRWSVEVEPSPKLSADVPSEIETRRIVLVLGGKLCAAHRRSLVAGRMVSEQMIGPATGPSVQLLVDGPK